MIYFVVLTSVILMAGCRERMEGLKRRQNDIKKNGRGCQNGIFVFISCRLLHHLHHNMPRREQIVAAIFEDQADKKPFFA
jgi:hypothetical protein